MGAICPFCFGGAHGQCIEQGCYCDCQLKGHPMPQIIKVEPPAEIIEHYSRLEASRVAVDISRDYADFFRTQIKTDEEKQQVMLEGVSAVCLRLGADIEHRILHPDDLMPLCPSAAAEGTPEESTNVLYSLPAEVALAREVGQIMRELRLAVGDALNVLRVAELNQLRQGKLELSLKLMAQRKKF